MVMDDPHQFSDKHARYSDYLAYAIEGMIPPKDILTYDQFIGMMPDNEENIEKVKLGFVIPVGSLATAADGLVNAADRITSGVKTARTVASALSMAREALQEGIDAASGSGSPGNPFMRIDAPPPPNGPGDGDSGSWNPGDYFDARKLNDNANPLEVKLNTGIIPNCYGAHYLDADATHSPLHLTGFRMAMPVVSTDPFYKFFDNVLSLAYQTLAQAAVSFNISAYQNLSTNRLYEYLNTLMFALSVYYFYASIITYASNPNNRNQGMLSLRKGMTASDLDSLYQLKRLLEGMPLPPNLNNLIFYLNQTFLGSSLPGAAIIKFMPFGFVTNATDTRLQQLATGQVDAAISLLTTSTFRLTESLIARICKDWLALKLLAPSDVPVHDTEFTTIFANAPFVYFGTTTYRSPTVVNSYDNITYNSYDDKLDGAVYGLASIYSSTNSRWMPSLVDVEGSTSSYTVSGQTVTSNRFSYAYDKNTGLTGFYQTDIIGYNNYSRPETYIGPGQASPFQRFGTEAALNVNADSIRETAYKLLEWILTLDSVKTSMGMKNASDNKRSKPRSRGKRGGGKTK